MHLLILGATGRTGVYAYKYALTQGHHVTALVRNASLLAPQEGLTVIQGSVISQADMDRAFSESGTPVDAALQFLDASRVSINPWSEFVGPARLLPDAAANLSRAMRNQQHQLPLPNKHKPRLLIMSGRGTGESIKTTPFYIRFLMRHSNLGKTYDGHESVSAEVEANCAEEIIWTLPMPVALGNAGLKDVKVFELGEKGPSQFITRESCARWMVDVAVGEMGNEFDNRRVVLSN